MRVFRFLLGAPGDDERGVGLGRAHADSHDLAGLAARAHQAIALYACSATALTEGTTCPRLKGTQ